MIKTLRNIQSKILTLSNLQDKLNGLHQNKKMVFTNGCFDILHKGHVEYLSQASDLGDIMIIGLNTDASVSRLKGSHRPLQDQSSRALVMASLSFVDYIVLFDEDSPYDLIKAIQPDVLVKGSDYKVEEVVGYDIVQAKGGRVETIALTEGYSTSNIEKKIQESLS